MKELFEDLYRRYRTRMYAIAYSLTQNRDRAEDLVQETFARAWRSFDTLHDPTRFGGWLRAILINAFKDHLEPRKPEPAPRETEDPSETAVRFEELLLLKSLIHSLDERDRVLLNLSHLQGHSNREIAQILGLEEGHVRVLLHRAREALKRKLSKPRN